MQPPRAKQVPYSFEIHGKNFSDPYAWLRYRQDDADVITYLEAENAYAKFLMKNTESLQADIFAEMCARMQLADTTVPYFDKGYYYYWRTTETQEYGLFCRKKAQLDAPEVVILDENQLAAGSAYYSLGDCEISHNQRYLAYTEDTVGNEEYTLFIKDLQENITIKTDINTISPSLVWAHDNATLFYIKLDETWRPFQLWSYHFPTQESRLWFTETDPTFSIGVSLSKTEAFILLETSSKNASETHYLPTEDLTASFTCLYPREPYVKYSVIPHEQHWYIRTNLAAKNYRLLRVPISNPQQDNWELIIDHQHHVKISHVEIFKDFLVVQQRQDASTQLRVISLKENQDMLITFPAQTYTATPINNVTFDSSILRVEYHSLNIPRTIYDIDLHTLQKTVLKQAAVLGTFSSSDYVCEKLYATAEDGTEIPISVVYHRDTPRDGSAPLYLYGYGSYGISINPEFSYSRLSLLNRGIIYAIAHIRGGGDNGEYWYESGKLLHKKNTFTDFITCAEHLIYLKYTSSQKLIISGGSAGGLLIGAVINMRPDLAHIAIADVPFVDVINTMLDPSIPLTTAEYAEWGNPEDVAYFDYIYGYSPYDNVEKKDYPALFVKAGLNDPRVQYWEPAKWVAKLRAYKTDNRPLLFDTDMTSGHGGASGRFAAMKEIAYEHAFILNELANPD